MIETKVEVIKDLEKALQALEQARQRVANEKKKQNEKKRKAENHHTSIGDIVMLMASGNGFSPSFLTDSGNNTSLGSIYLS